MSRKIVYKFKYKGLSLYCDERIKNLNSVICGHLNKMLGDRSKSSEFKMLYNLHSALDSYMEFYGID